MHICEIPDQGSQYFSSRKESFLSLHAYIFLYTLLLLCTVTFMPVSVSYYNYYAVICFIVYAVNENILNGVVILLSLNNKIS